MVRTRSSSPLPLIVRVPSPRLMASTGAFDDGEGNHRGRDAEIRWLHGTSADQENIGVATSVSPHKLCVATLDVPAVQGAVDGLEKRLRTPTKARKIMGELATALEEPSIHHSPSESSLSSSPYSSPTMTRQSQVGRTSNSRSASPVGSPSRCQLSQTKQGPPPPPPYSRYNTYTYSVKFQQRKQLGLDAPFPALLESIPGSRPLLSTASVTLDSGLPTPVKTPTGERQDPFGGYGRPTSPHMNRSPHTKSSWMSHAHYNPTSPDGSYPSPTFGIRVGPKSPPPQPRVSSSLSAAPAGLLPSPYNLGPDETHVINIPPVEWRQCLNLLSLRLNGPRLSHLPAAMHAARDSSTLWMAMYFIFNLGLTLYNKGVLVKFPFPYTLTALHTFCGTVGTTWLWYTGYFVPARLTTKENITLSLFSILYTLNIAISNVSLQLVTVPFHQVVRASAPIPTILITYMLMGGRGRGFLGVGQMKLFSLVPVMVGVGFATYGDYYYTGWGLFLTLLGTLLAALKTVLTNMLQTTTTTTRVTFPTARDRSFSSVSSKAGPVPPLPIGSTRLKLHPLDLLLRMSPLAFAQCVVYSYLSGEMYRVHRFTTLEMTAPRTWALLINGCIAFGLNVVSFTANKKSGPLAMTVAANVKQVLTIVLAVVIFNLSITATNGFGILLTLAGGIWYAAIEYQNKQERSTIHGRADSKDRRIVC